MTTIIDTDKSGLGFQKQKVWLGPSLGWSEEYVQPSTLITSGPTYAVQPGDGMLLIDVPGGITIQLPDVRTWFQQPATQPATGWNRQLCIKDFGGNAEIGNIVLQPFDGQRIDEFIGPTAMTVNNAVVLLVPNIDLKGWILAAGTTSVLIPVGTFLPVHDPNATGKLTVREIGGDILALQGGAAGSQSVVISADAASVDADVNIHLIPKNAGGILMYSNGSLQVAVSGSAGNNKFIALTGGSPGLNPSISSSFGGPIDVRDSVRVGPTGGNRGTVAGSDPGQQAIIYGVDPTSPDANVNIHLIPKNSGGTLLYANNSLQMAISGPAGTTEYLVVSGATGLEDPLIANSSGQPIRLDSAILVGPAGGNFAGLYGSAGSGQAVSLRADNESNPDVNVNIHLIPKGAGSTLFYSNGVPQALVNGPANTARYVSLMGAPATSNPIIQAAFGVDIDILNANLTGVPHCPTAAPGTNTTQVASTAFVIANAGGGGGAFVPLAGGTMTGPLTIAVPAPPDAQLVLNGTGAVGMHIIVNAFGESTRIYQAASTFAIGNGTIDMIQGDLVLGNVLMPKTLFLGSNAANPQGGHAVIANGVTSPTTSVGLYQWSNDGGAPRIFFGKSRGAIGVQGAVQNGDRIFDINSSASDGTAFRNAYSIACLVDAAPSAGRVPASLYFMGTNAAGAVEQKMRIDSVGTVAIGQGPFFGPNNAQLQIDGTTGSMSSIILTDYQAAAGSSNLAFRHSRGALGAHGALLVNDPLGQLNFQGSDGTNWITGAALSVGAHVAPSGGRLQTRFSFQTDNGIDYGERIRIFPSGGLSLAVVGGFAVDPGAGNIIAGLKGVTDASNATAGQVGEQVQSLVQTAVTMGPGGTQVVLTTIALTAGDWDVSAMVTAFSSSGVASFELGISTTGTLSGLYDSYLHSTCPGPGTPICASIPSARFPLSGPATISLVCRPTGANLTATAVLRARRER